MQKFALGRYVRKLQMHRISTLPSPVNWQEARAYFHWTSMCQKMGRQDLSDVSRCILRNKFLSMWGKLIYLNCYKLIRLRGLRKKEVLPLCKPPLVLWFFLVIQIQCSKALKCCCLWILSVKGKRSLWVLIQNYDPKIQTISSLLLL